MDDCNKDIKAVNIYKQAMLRLVLCRKQTSRHSSLSRRKIAIDKIIKKMKAYAMFLKLQWFSHYRILYGHSPVIENKITVLKKYLFFMCLAALLSTAGETVCVCVEMKVKKVCGCIQNIEYCSFFKKKEPLPWVTSASQHLTLS